MRQTPFFVPPLSPGYAEEDQSREETPQSCDEAGKEERRQRVADLGQIHGLVTRAAHTG
jgi:hypothetical protein